MAFHETKEKHTDHLQSCRNAGKRFHILCTCIIFAQFTGLQSTKEVQQLITENGPPVSISCDNLDLNDKTGVDTVETVLPTSADRAMIDDKDILV